MQISQVLPTFERLEKVCKNAIPATPGHSFLRKLFFIRGADYSNAIRFTIQILPLFLLLQRSAKSQIVCNPPTKPGRRQTDPETPWT